MRIINDDHDYCPGKTIFCPKKIGHKNTCEKPLDLWPTRGKIHRVQQFSTAVGGSWFWLTSSDFFFLALSFPLWWSDFYVVQCNFFRIFDLGAGSRWTALPSSWFSVFFFPTREFIVGQVFFFPPASCDALRRWIWWIIIFATWVIYDDCVSSGADVNVTDRFNFFAGGVWALYWLRTWGRNSL